MAKTLSSLRRWCLVGVLAVLVLTGGFGVPALRTMDGVATTYAQPAPREAPQPMRPPTPPTTRTTRSAWVEYLAVVFLGLLILGVNCIPSKRGHQD